MKTKSLVTALLLTVCYSKTVLAQNIVFAPPALPILIGAQDVIVDIPYTVNPHPAFGASYSLTFTAPTVNNLTLGPDYAFLSPLTATLSGANNSGSVRLIIKARAAGYTGTANITINVSWSRGGANGNDASPNITIQYGIPVGALQPVYYPQYVAEIANINSEYNCNSPVGDLETGAAFRATAKAVQADVLDSNLYTVFSNVVLGSNDVITTGRAASIVQDKEKGILNLNTSFVRGNSSGFFGKPATRAINIGLVAKSSGGFYDVFTDDGWSKEVGINFGLSYILHNGIQNFNTPACRELRAKRNVFYRTLLSDYYKVLSENLAGLHAAVGAIDARLALANISTDIHKKNEVAQLDSTKHSLESRIRRCNALYTDVVNPLNGSADLTKVRANLQKEIAMFERQNDVLTGYKVMWWDFKGSFAYSTINLSTDSIKNDPKKDEYSKMGMLKSSAQMSYNITGLSDYRPNQSGKLYFFQFSLLAEQGSFLDVQGIVGKPSIRKTGEDSYSIINVDNDDTLGIASDLTIPIWTLSPGMYYAVFGGTDQQLGWDVRASYRLVLDDYPGSKLVNTYNIFTGPVFRVAGEKDFSKATIGLKAGLSNAIVGTHRLWQDHFTLRLEVGVPFKWYYKSKS